MRRFKQLLAGRQDFIVTEIPLKRWFGDASHPAQRELEAE